MRYGINAPKEPSFMPEKKKDKHVLANLNMVARDSPSPSGGSASFIETRSEVFASSEIGTMEIEETGSWEDIMYSRCELGQWSGASTGRN